jgi:hypothetical protein
LNAVSIFFSIYYIFVFPLRLFWIHCVSLLL